MNTLTIAIDTVGVRNLAAADQKIVLVWSGVGTPPLLIAWLACAPAQFTSVTWTDTYQVFASLGPLTVGVPVELSFQASATPGMKYTVGSGGFGPGQDGTAGSYEIVDDVAGPPSIVGGLAQQWNVDGGAATWSPAGACVIPRCETGVLQGSASLLAFVASGVATAEPVDASWFSANGDVVVVGTPLHLDFSATATQAIRFDDARNAFVPAGDGVQAR